MRGIHLPRPDGPRRATLLARPLALVARLLPLVTLLASLLASPPATADETDGFFRKGEIPSIDIVLEPASADSLRNDPRTYAKVALVVDGKPLAESAGIKLKGAAGSYQGFDERPGFTINLGKFDGTARFHGMRKFHLNNAVQDPTFLSEWTASSILREANVPATRVSHARVRIAIGAPGTDGAIVRDMGLYVFKESFDGAFLKEHFRNTGGNLYDGGFCQDIDADLERDEGKGEETRADLRALSEACRDPDMKARWKKIEELVDVPEFVRFLALEAMLAHWDGYAFNSNNYRLYFEPGKGARFIPHGMDQCFQDPGMSVLDMPRALVASSVMKNPEWRSDYRRAIVRLLPEFDARKLVRRLEPVQKRVQDALRAVSPEAAAAQAEAANAFVERLAARAQSLAEQKSAPEPKPLVFKTNAAVAIRGFHGMSEVEDANVEEVDENGARWYRVTAGPSGRCVAGFRRSVLLEKGRYRFEAVLRTDGVATLEEPDAPGAGAGIRTSGTTRADGATGGGERPVSFEFDVTEATADIELVLELRARAGTAMWRADSITLTRVRERKPREE